MYVGRFVCVCGHMYICMYYIYIYICVCVCVYAGIYTPLFVSMHMIGSLWCRMLHISVVLL